MKAVFLLPLLFTLSLAIPIDAIENAETLAPISDDSLTNLDLTDSSITDDEGDFDLSDGTSDSNEYFRKKLKGVFSAPKKIIKKIIIHKHRDGKPTVKPVVKPVEKPVGKNITIKKLADSVSKKVESAKPSAVKVITISYVDKLKADIEKEHLKFMKMYDLELKKLKELTSKKELKQKEYESARLLVKQKFEELKKLLELLKAQHSNVEKIKDDKNEYDDEKYLVSHLNEYIKIYKSSLDENRFYKSNCICNHTIN